MFDLVGGHARLGEICRLYVESAFPLRYSALDAERRRALRESDVLAQEPLVEPVPMYPVANCTLAEAGRRLGSDDTGLSSLAAGLLAPNANLYEHQWDSLNAVIAGQKDLVVTTGTGSGKTECFLLPLLAELARESMIWRACGSATDRFWWRQKNDRSSQFEHSRRPHAVRALILYPLNALVENQLRRYLATRRD
jgi:DEAD/DEAH box helicase domain-containing protein